MAGTGRTDHVCSGRTCMFCRVLDGQKGPKATYSGVRAQLDSRALDRAKEMENSTLLSATQSTLASSSRAEELDRLALLDSLTELYNSRTFIKELKDEMKRAKRYKRPVSLCILTIDKFKEISGQYGILAAEAILKVVANILRSAVRDVDVPARYSAEGFAVILPETNAQGALIAAERIRQRLSQQDITHNWNSLRVTASIGISSFPAHAKEYDELIAKAIQSLELAMQRGGDRICSC